jgi:HPt (histidine-containing phosphotransfer) domain-containing protein
VQEPVDASSLLALRQLQPPGAPDAVGRIIAHFLEESAKRLAVLRQAADTDDADILQHTAHALKGIAGTVGATEMHQLAVRLEQIGREGSTDGAAGLVTELESAFGGARPIFDRLRDAA